MLPQPIRFIALLALIVLSSPAPARREPLPPTGELLLDMADPMIDLLVGRVALRLRVALDQKRVIELNPAAVERLRQDPPDSRFAFESGFDAQVGRETLSGIQAAAQVRINGRKMVVALSSHGRDCCLGADGEIGIGLLPYATIRFVRQGAPPATSSEDFPIDDNIAQGPETDIPIGTENLFVQFSLHRPASVATGAAGAILAQAHGGSLTEGGTVIAAFGIARPAAMLHFPRPVMLAGFAFDQIPVRTADFTGRHQFPHNPDEPGDIVVRGKVVPQSAWPAVMIGRDKLDRCSEALFDSIARRLTLRCAAGAI